MTRLRASRFAGQARHTAHHSRLDDYGQAPFWQEAIAAGGMLLFFAAALFLAGAFGPPL
jgi:hypothetical protein